MHLSSVKIRADVTRASNTYYVLTRSPKEEAIMAKASLPESNPTCIKCGETKVVEMFVRDPRRASGIGAWCRQCKNTQVKAWAQRNGDHLKELARDRWAKNGKVREQGKARVYRWKDANRERWLEIKGQATVKRRARDKGLSVEEYLQLREERKVGRVADSIRAHTGRVLDAQGVEMPRLRCPKHRKCPFISAYPKLEYQINKAHHLARNRRWNKENPDKAYQKKLRRKMRIAKVQSDLTLDQWNAIVRMFGGRCAYCGAMGKKLTRDHITPISKGGADTVSNIVPACMPCNSSKHTGPPPCAVQPLLCI